MILFYSHSLLLLGGNFANLNSESFTFHYFLLLHDEVWDAVLPAEGIEPKVEATIPVVIAVPKDPVAKEKSDTVPKVLLITPLLLLLEQYLGIFAVI